MLKILAFIISIFLITIILLKIPEESIGLSSLVTKNNLLVSPNLFQRFLNIGAGIGILIYFLIALKLDFIM
jgi:preprotein translocase subunit SecG